MVQWPIDKFMIRRYLTRKIRTITTQSHGGRASTSQSLLLASSTAQEREWRSPSSHTCTLYRQLQRKGAVRAKETGREKQNTATRISWSLAMFFIPRNSAVDKKENEIQLPRLPTAIRGIQREMPRQLQARPFAPPMCETPTPLSTLAERHPLAHLLGLISLLLVCSSCSLST